MDVSLFGWLPQPFFRGIPVSVSGKSRKRPIFFKAVSKGSLGATNLADFNAIHRVCRATIALALDNFSRSVVKVYSFIYRGKASRR